MSGWAALTCLVPRTRERTHRTLRGSQPTHRCGAHWLPPDRLSRTPSRQPLCKMADVGASKEMLLHQLNALMADAAGDAETMELYQAKLAELDAARRANADLEQQLLN